MKITDINTWKPRVLKDERVKYVQVLTYELEESEKQLTTDQIANMVEVENMPLTTGYVLDYNISFNGNKMKIEHWLKEIPQEDFTYKVVAPPLIELKREPTKEELEEMQDILDNTEAGEMKVVKDTTLDFSAGDQPIHMDNVATKELIKLGEPQGETDLRIEKQKGVGKEPDFEIAVSEMDLWCKGDVKVEGNMIIGGSLQIGEVAWVEIGGKLIVGGIEVGNTWWDRLRRWFKRG